MALDLDHHICQLADLLYARNDILCTHPNDLDLSVLPPAWVVPSQDLLEYYITGFNRNGVLPGDLKDLVDCIRRLQLPRAPLHIPEACLMSMKGAKGMSPKKAHEVQRMASYIQALADANNGFGPGPLHIVDVGAGQGYLTRALAQLFPAAEILALDADEGQTVGAEMKLGKQKTAAEATNPRITHKTALIKPASLLKAIDEWVSGTGSDQPVPVLFVALHACGSLTPDTLRAVMDAQSEERRSKGWYPCAAVIVGCCYNLMYPGDYPLSTSLNSYPPCTERPLPASAYHLAAQIPGTWLVADKKQPTTWKMQPSMELSTRKIVWRAMLGYSIKACNAQPSGDTPVSPPQPGAGKSAEIPVKWWLETGKQENGAFNRLPSVDRSDAAKQVEGVGQTTTSIRLGKLPDAAYTQGWVHFMQVAGRKLGIDWGGCNDEDQKAFLSSFRDESLERRVETLHILRCLLGPAIESAILLDRLAWLREALSNEGSDLKADLVSLFDQTTGSGRNVAICIAPHLPGFEPSEQARQ